MGGGRRAIGKILPFRNCKERANLLAWEGRDAEGENRVNMSPNGGKDDILTREKAGKRPGKGVETRGTTFAQGLDRAFGKRNWKTVINS